MLPPAGRAEEAQETLNVPGDAERRGQRPPEPPPRREANSGSPNWELSLTLLVIILTSRIKQNLSRNFPLCPKENYFSRQAKKRKGQDPRKLSSLWTRREGEYAFCFFFVSGRGGRKLGTYFLKISPRPTLKAVSVSRESGNRAPACSDTGPLSSFLKPPRQLTAPR